MENKGSPQQEELLPVEQGVFPPEEPSYEEGAFPDGDLLLMDGAAQTAPQPQAAEDTAYAEEPPMSDEEFQAFMMMNAVPEEAPVQEVPQAVPADQEVPVVAPEQTVPAPIVMEPPVAAYEEQEDPLAPECPVEEDPLARELREAEALLAEKQDVVPEASEVTAAEPEEPAAPAPAHRAPRKGRPRRKKGEGLFGIPNILATGVWLAVVVLVGVTLGRMLWVCAADVLAFGREDRPVTITIYESDTIEEITQKLHQADLIKYPGLFKLYARFAVDEGEIRPGIWDLNTRYDYHALVSMMSPSSSRSVVEIMIPEGYSCAQIFALLEENKVCTAQDLKAYAATGELDYYWFLDGIDRGEDNCLEGYLFPDTYQFYTNDSPRSVLQKMLDNFGYRFTDEMLQQLPALNEYISAMMRQDGRSQEYIDAHQLTLKDVVIVASLIEKETASAEEGYTIASVIYNRLFRWGDTPAYLNIDAAMVYALGGKTDLTAEDLRIDHPYNTYLYTGLTPGPIANPGLASLKAALEPAETNYYYYVLDPAAGDHHFSTTYEEHQAFIASLGG